MIVCSISTIPGRLESLITILTRLLESTIYPDIIIITIANYYPRLNKFYSSDEMSKLLSYLQTYKINTKITYQDVDIGPVVKIKSALEYWNNLKKSSEDDINEKEDVIIILDDDSGLYEKSIELLTDAYIKHGDGVYGIMGKIGNDTYVHGEFLSSVGKEYTNVDLLGGYRGVLYPIHLLKKNDTGTTSPATKSSKKITFFEWIDMFIKYHKKKNLIAMHDDDIFYYWAKYNNIERRVVKVPCDIPNFIYYNPINNTNGIFNDKDCNIALDMIKETLKENKLEHLI